MIVIPAMSNFGSDSVNKSVCGMLILFGILRIPLITPKENIPGVISFIPVLILP